MKALYLACAMLLAIPGVTLAQDATPAQPAKPAKPAKPVKPAKPDASSKLPDTGKDKATPNPAESDIVRVPPPTGTESITRPPKNIDPGMDDATERIDRKNMENMPGPKKPGSDIDPKKIYK